MTAAEISKALRALGDPNIAEHSTRFFKTGPGEYGEGDQFLGIRVPVLRKHVTTFAGTPLDEVIELLHSPMHEERLFALLLMVRQFGRRGPETGKCAIYQAYLANTAWIDNWDLVDSSAHQIVGAWLFGRDRAPLYTLVESNSLWERRIAMIATYHFIKRDDFKDALALAEALLEDPEDLMHKASGWMLRELGKRDPDAERAFLDRHCRRMPRTMLRYAIEKLSPEERRHYLDGG